MQLYEQSISFLLFKIQVANFGPKLNLTVPILRFRNTDEITRSDNNQVGFELYQNI